MGVVLDGGAVQGLIPLIVHVRVAGQHGHPDVGDVEYVVFLVVFLEYRRDGTGFVAGNQAGGINPGHILIADEAADNRSRLPRYGGAAVNAQGDFLIGQLDRLRFGAGGQADECQQQGKDACSQRSFHLKSLRWRI